MQLKDLLEKADHVADGMSAADDGLGQDFPFELTRLTQHESVFGLSGTVRMIEDLRGGQVLTDRRKFLSDAYVKAAVDFVSAALYATQDFASEDMAAAESVCLAIELAYEGRSSADLIGFARGLYVRLTERGLDGSAGSFVLVVSIGALLWQAAVRL